MSDASSGPELDHKPGLPDVSAVVATHNRPELLRAAVAGIIDQEYDGAIECIIVFDRSEPDMTLERDDTTATGHARRVRVITNTRTPGLAGARNSGITAGSSELVAFCDDDDEWLPGKLDAQVRLMNGRVVAAVSGISVAYADHTTTRIPEGDRLDLADLVRNRVMEAHPSSVIVRRDALEGPIGLVDEELPGSYAEDFDWIIRAARAGDIAIARGPFVLVRWGQSLFSRNWEIIIEAVDRLLEKHPELRASRQGKARLLGRRAFANAAQGNRRAALGDAMHTLKLRPTERRALLAIAVALRLVSAERLMAWAHRRGKGI